MEDKFLQFGAVGILMVVVLGLLKIIESHIKSQTKGFMSIRNELRRGRKVQEIQTRALLRLVSLTAMDNDHSGVLERMDRELNLVDEVEENSGE